MNRPFGYALSVATLFFVIEGAMGGLVAFLFAFPIALAASGSYRSWKRRRQMRRQGMVLKVGGAR